jgi:hypothetical protein
LEQPQRGPYPAGFFAGQANDKGIKAVGSLLCAESSRGESSGKGGEPAGSFLFVQTSCDACAIRCLVLTSQGLFEKCKKIP